MTPESAEIVLWGLWFVCSVLGGLVALMIAPRLFPSCNVSLRCALRGHRWQIAEARAYVTIHRCDHCGRVCPTWADEVPE